MPLEPITDGFLPTDLNDNWPQGSDSSREGDNHLRLIKRAVKNGFATSVRGSGKAAFIPEGTTAQRPVAADFPPDTVALRMNTTLNEMEAVDKSGQAVPIGGGGMPPLIPTLSTFTVAKKKAYAVDMSDGVSKVATVTQGMLDNDWFSINTTLWDRNVEGLGLTIDFGSEVITNGKKDFNSLLLDRPCISYFTKVNGKWMWSDGAGLDGSYEKLLRKIEELESWPQHIVTPTGTAIKHKDDRLECWAKVTFSPSPQGASVPVTEPAWAHPFVSAPVYCIFSPVTTPNSGNKEALGLLNYNGVYQQHTATHARLACYAYRAALALPVEVIVYASGYWR